MDLGKIIDELEEEKARIEAALQALRGRTILRGPGRRGKRHLSEAARRRISEAMTKRWAERKEAASKKGPKAA